MSLFTKKYLESRLANELIVDSSNIKEIRTWLLGHKLHFQAIVRIWFKELVKSRNDKKLAFMYLAYDVIWHSIKDCPQFVTEFGTYMEKVFEHLVTVNFDEKAIGNIGEFIKIWRKRRIFDEQLQGAVEKIWKEGSVDEIIVVKEIKKEKGCVDELPPHLTCSVCSGLLKEPVQLPCCKTALCKLCVFAKLEQRSACWFGFCPKSVVVRKDEVKLSPELAIQVDLWKTQYKERFNENSPVTDLEDKKNVGLLINASTKIEYIEANDPLDSKILSSVASENLSKSKNNNLSFVNDKANVDLDEIKNNEDFNRNGKNCNQDDILPKTEMGIRGEENGEIEIIIKHEGRFHDNDKVIHEDNATQGREKCFKRSDGSNHKQHFEIQNSFNGQIGKEKCGLEGNVAEQKGHSCTNHWLCDKNSNAGCLLQWINPSGEENEQCTVSLKDSPMRKAMKRRIHCDEEGSKKKSQMSKQNVDDNREAPGIVRIADASSLKEKIMVNPRRTEWVKVCGDEIEEPINIATENDGTLLQSSITSQFPGTTGLKYRNPRTNHFHNVIRHKNGMFLAPKEGWTGIKFVCVRYKQCEDAHEAALKAKQCEVTQQEVVQKTKEEYNHCKIPGGPSGHKVHDGSLYHIILELPKEISGQDIRCHFQKFGKVLTVQLRKSLSGDFWGNAFIKFADKEVVDKIIGHQLIGDQWCSTVRVTDSNAASNARKDNEKNEGQIYVGQVTEAITAQNLKNHFETFGQVTAVRIPKPRRNFAFVHFSDRNVVASLLGRGDHVIKGVTVKIEKAIKKRGMVL